MIISTLSCQVNDEETAEVVALRLTGFGLGTVVHIMSREIGGSDLGDFDDAFEASAPRPAWAIVSP